MTSTYAALKLWGGGDFLDLAASRSQWYPGDVIQPMLVEVLGSTVTSSRRTLRVLQRHDREGELPEYTAIDRYGKAHRVLVCDDPRPGNLADAEEGD